jgi:hypothetical protein
VLPSGSCNMITGRRRAHLMCLSTWVVVGGASPRQGQAFIYQGASPAGLYLYIWSSLPLALGEVNSDATLQWERLPAILYATLITWWIHVVCHQSQGATI